MVPVSGTIPRILRAPVFVQDLRSFCLELHCMMNTEGLSRLRCDGHGLLINVSLVLLLSDYLDGFQADDKLHKHHPELQASDRIASELYQTLIVACIVCFSPVFLILFDS